MPAAAHAPLNPRSLGPLLGVALAGLLCAAPARGQQERPSLFGGADDNRPGAAAYAESETDQEAATRLFAEAEALHKEERLYEAHERYFEILELHPDFDQLATVIDREYELGTAFIEGKIDRPFLFLFSRSGRSLGAEVLRFLLDRFEQSRFDYARFLIAEHYFHEGRFEKAARQYALVEEAYPQSVWVGVSRYQRAICYLRQARGYRYDDEDVRRAEALLLDYARRYPNGNRIREAEEALASIRGSRARLYLENAVFYLEREHSPRAAMIYLQAILREAPEAPSAERVAPLLRRIAKRTRTAPEAAADARRLLRRAAVARRAAARERTGAGASGAAPRPGKR